jgi:hypothetical protein
MKFLLIIFIASLAQTSYAFGRTHEYILKVADYSNNPLSNIRVKTTEIRGYDQSYVECTTSVDGKCALTLSAFAPSNTRIVVVLQSADPKIGIGGRHTLPVMENSFFSNSDSLDVSLAFDVEGAKSRRMEESLAAEEQIRRENQAREKRLKLAQELELAEIAANISCKTKASCEKAFELTEVFFATAADLKIQTATKTTLETFNPSKDGDIGLRALKVPQSSDGANIVLTVSCAAEGAKFKEFCITKKIDTYNNFRIFMRKSFQD